jgi:hypothetical protein
MKLAVWRKPNQLCNPGLMTIDGAYFGQTIERPWADNKRGISCIPAGIYPVAIRHSPKFNRPMLIIDNVRGRSGILIHGANHWSELKGCVAVAETRVDDERIQGDLSKELKLRVQAAFNRGEKVTIQMVDPKEGV